MSDQVIRVGTLVEHPRVPEWGPGKVAHVRGDKVHVLFRDLSDRRTKLFKVEQLRLAPAQSDPVLDNLPPFTDKDGAFYLPAERMTVQQAKQKFLERFPGGFADPNYFGDRKSGERVYKWRAHEHFVDTLGGGQLEHLLEHGDIEELVRRAQQVVSRVNLLAMTEAAAFREGLADEGAATAYFHRLTDLLNGGPSETVFERYAAAVASLPAEGATHTDKWTIATILPFLAQPAIFMFVKPTITRTAAERLGFDLRYDARPNWTTYDRVLHMSRLYMDLLRDLGPRDLIDIQSFFWVTGEQYEQVSAAQQAKQNT
jgi:hypothetical protein